jgi:hypothetical protein
VGKEDDDRGRDVREDHGDDYEDAVSGIKAYRDARLRSAAESAAPAIVVRALDTTPEGDL